MTTHIGNTSSPSARRSGTREGGRHAQLGCRLELRDRIQFREYRSERVGETPYRSRPELLILRLELEVMPGSGMVLGRFHFAFDESLVDDH
jgi:hypothetical protein